MAHQVTCPLSREHVARPLENRAHAAEIGKSLRVREAEQSAPPRGVRREPEEGGVRREARLRVDVRKIPAVLCTADEITPEKTSRFLDDRDLRRGRA